MAAPLFEIDPTSEDAANTPLVLTTDPLRLTGMDLTPPELAPMFASSADTEGDPFVDSRYRNRTISLELLAKASTDALTQTAVYGVQQKIEKLRREGGTLKITTAAGTAVVADVLYATFKPEFKADYYLLNKAVPFTLDFECKPLLRGAEAQLTDHAETTLPAAIGVDSAVGGDVSATVKILIDEDQGADQWWLIWGLQSRYYDSAASAALFYEAEGRTALGGSATAAGPSGASGGGSNVMRNTALTTSYQAILSTQATGGGAYLSHVGDFRVFARVQTPTTNTGAVSVAFEWSEGDFRRVTRNAQASLPVDAWDGTWRLLDLGLVHLTKVVAGTQRWEGRILAKSTVAGDDIDVDYLFLVPATEGSGEVSAVQQFETPTSFSARDEFDQTAGALTGKTAAVGGTWTVVASSDADDFSVDATNHVATRVANSDTAETGRFVSFSTTNFAAITIQADVTPDSTGNAYTGMFARCVDINNHVRAMVNLNEIIVFKRVGGGSSVQLGYHKQALGIGTMYRIRLTIDAAGRWYFWFNDATVAPSAPLFMGQDDVLKTAGTLATGKAGVCDENPGGTSATRKLDNVFVAVPVGDAALFASQSLELRSDQVNREDSGGTLWQKPSRYEGQHPKVPPAGKEARSVRIIVKACRNDPATMPDSAIDDISFRATVTPRYLVLPS